MRYTRKSLKPYLPAALEPYLAGRKLVGIPLMESEIEVLKAIASAGGAATVLVLARTLRIAYQQVAIFCHAFE